MRRARIYKNLGELAISLAHFPQRLQLGDDFLRQNMEFLLRTFLIDFFEGKVFAQIARNFQAVRDFTFQRVSHGDCHWSVVRCLLLAVMK